MATTIDRVNAAADKAMQSPAMHRILMDVNDAVVMHKIIDAFIEGAKCGAETMGGEVLAKLKGARNDVQGD